MKSSSLTRPLPLKHNNHFREACGSLDMESQQIRMQRRMTSDKLRLRVSPVAALQISKVKSHPRTMGEQSVKPCILDGTRDIVGPQSSTKT